MLLAALIVFFTYFYTALVFNPIDLADNLRKQGGFIPGVRPGKTTVQYIENVLNRITLPGALFLAAIAVLPTLLFNAHEGHRRCSSSAARRSSSWSASRSRR